jgi:hypothetical protein
MCTSLVEEKIICVILNSRVVTSTSATIPKANMKVVIPNMNILGGDEVKPGLLLKVIYYKHAFSFLL